MALTRRARSRGILFCRRVLVSRVSVSLERIVAFLVVLHPASSALCLALKAGSTDCTKRMWRRGCGRMRGTRERITLLLNHIYVRSLLFLIPQAPPSLCLPACAATWNKSVVRRAELFADSKLFHERATECRDRGDFKHQLDERLDWSFSKSWKKIRFREG